VKGFLFRHRFWAIAALIFAGFSCYWLDPRNVAVAALEGLGLDPESEAFGAWVRAAFGFGALLGLLAACLRTWAAAYLTSDVVRDPSVRTESLVADGPYRHVRNPLYLGLLLLTFGSALAASRLGFAFLTVGMTALTLAFISHEEEGLATARGAGYDAYRRAVPRLLPSLRPRVPPSGRRPRWGQAFAGESFFWVFALAGAAFALTLDGRVFGGICVGGMGLHWLSALAWARRKGRPPASPGPSR